jgi:hypothetical protein
MIYLLMKGIIFRRGGYNFEIKVQVIRRVFLSLITLFYQIPYLLQLFKIFAVFIEGDKGSIEKGT